MSDRDHDEFLFEYLQDPRNAAYYLNAALEDSDEMFLESLRDIASAAKMAKVAARAGVARQAIYRMLKKGGNPTFASLMAILRALGLRFAIESDIIEVPANPRTGQSVLIGESTTQNVPIITDATDTEIKEETVRDSMLWNRPV